MLTWESSLGRAPLGSTSVCPRGNIVCAEIGPHKTIIVLASMRFISSCHSVWASAAPNANLTLRPKNKSANCMGLPRERALTDRTSLNYIPFSTILLAEECNIMKRVLGHHNSPALKSQEAPHSLSAITAHDTAHDWKGAEPRALRHVRPPQPITLRQQRETRAACSAVQGRSSDPWTRDRGVTPHPNSVPTPVLNSLVLFLRGVYFSTLTIITFLLHYAG